MDKKEKYDIEKIIENVHNDAKKKKYLFNVYEVMIMVFFTCILSFFVGSAITELKFSNNDNYSSDKKITIDDKNLEEFIKNYQYILNNYYADITKEDLIKGAIEGMMSVLDDPFSIYMDDEYDNLNITLDGSYQGIGIEIVKNGEGYLDVLRVFENTPAKEAGIQIGDVILKINDMETKDLTSSDFSKMVTQGTENEFKLNIKRGEEIFEIVITKKDISLKSVESKIINRDNKKIGYMYVSIFAVNTYAQFKEQLTDLEKENIDALIIDLRSNTGGHLSSAENICSLFLDSNHIIYQVVKDDKTTQIKSTGKKNKTYQIVFLADNYTASASELLIACLKENLDAKVIGLTTYGKGTIQELIGLSNGNQYKITTKKWLTPEGNFINNVGISPDIEVKLSSEYYQNPSDDTDNQLKEAINYILGK